MADDVEVRVVYGLISYIWRKIQNRASYNLVSYNPMSRVHTNFRNPYIMLQGKQKVDRPSSTDLI